MARLVHFVKSFAAYAVRPGAQLRASVLYTYVVISLIDGLRLPRRSLHVLGRAVTFPDPFGMRFLIEEIILGRHYASWTPARTNPVIIDAGANIGLATLYFKRLFPTARIISVEPHPSTARYLRANVGLGQIEGVEVVESALAGDERPRAIRGENISASLTDPEESDAILVDSVVFRSLVPDGMPIDILKMDIEGTELEVLRDIRADLPRIDQILAQIHIWETEPDPLPEILEILIEAGHRYELLHWVYDREG